MQRSHFKKGFDKKYVIPYVMSMETMTATSARSNLYALIDEAGEFHRPIQITGKRHNAVLISDEDWRAIQETLFLCSIPKMRESIREGMATPVKKCRKNLSW